MLNHVFFANCIPAEELIKPIHFINTLPCHIFYLYQIITATRHLYIALSHIVISITLLLIGQPECEPTFQTHKLSYRTAPQSDLLLWRMKNRGPDKKKAELGDKQPDF